MRETDNHIVNKDIAVSGVDNRSLQPNEIGTLDISFFVMIKITLFLLLIS